MCIRDRNISLGDGLPNRVDVHARTRSFQPITRVVSSVSYLKPQSTLRILILSQRSNQMTQLRKQLWPSWMILRQKLKNLDQGHGEPTHRPAPDLRRLLRLFIRPNGLTAFVVSVKH